MHQCLSTIVKFWQFVAAFVKIMPLLQRSKVDLHSSYFLKCLKRIISKAGNPAFDLFSQQDAAEMLSNILEKLCEESLAQYASSILQLNGYKQQYTPTAVSESIHSSLNSYLESNLFSGKNDSFCNICSSNSQALADQEISTVGDSLIIQVKHFLVFNQAMTKDISKISCTPALTVPVTLDEDVGDHKKFNLIATINHSGNLARGHHSSFIKSTSSAWFHCNNIAVLPSIEAALNNDTSYIFFYKNVS